MLILITVCGLGLEFDGNIRIWAMRLTYVFLNSFWFVVYIKNTFEFSAESG